MTSRIALETADLESTLLESSHEVIRLTAKDNLVDVELVRSTDDLAVREVTRLVSLSEH
jgi:hypothetical protein